MKRILESLKSSSVFRSFWSGVNAGEPGCKLTKERVALREHNDARLSVIP
jgi:hypothetical protein